ncbi:UDP-N-acetylmuramate dehydrogenase [Ilyomonas limi]|uniref:UDP-N-acetylenolpyruvoylglucosamine reductase n=1 Tax=Ilyomonas limi TaxID=2575867 RepID=A0A4U3L0Q1_9BACT|nr:UDP-N-acetylmuramate dehydrogenase [Ilyomonas limi]TKK67734.1 UDP-N-acetylmuramate dehydrogenase [Ilyomonas limi]
MQLQQNVSLYPYNTFHIHATAKYFAAFTTLDELQEALDFFYKQQSTSTPQDLLVLGGGSNILFTKDIDGLVLKNEMHGIEVVDESEEFYYVQSAAGENWHQLVMYCVAHNYAGMENLSLIPGSVGASPMQNIGAYGVEIKDIFHQLQAYDLLEKTIVNFDSGECHFGYRESVFKHQYKGRFVILNVTFKLRKTPVFNIAYGAIKEELEKTGVQELSIRAISQAVINIRKSKLPDPAVIGNAGSFFKNPVIDNAHFYRLKETFPTIAGYAAGRQQTKVAAGWLIEQCGWKGYRNGDAGCYNKQALVLVNYGNATGGDIYNLSTAIIRSVQDKFGITLEREVNIL